VAHGYYQEKLIGSVDNLYYYYTNIYLGSPAKPMTAIVNTGGYATTIPCDGCKNCGDHMDEFFHLRYTSSKEKIPCD
jgi:hypothetical protein